MTTKKNTYLRKTSLFRGRETEVRSTDHYTFHVRSNPGFKTIAGSDGFGGAVEEMNERSVMKAICSIEQRLLLDDHSPSVHNAVDVAKSESKQRAGDVMTRFHPLGQRLQHGPLVVQRAEGAPKRPSEEGIAPPAHSIEGNGDRQDGPRERRLRWRYDGSQRWW